MPEIMTSRCGHCGQFCIIADEYTPWGRSQDTEPPDVVLLCAACSRAEEHVMVAAHHVWMPYIPGQCHINARRRLLEIANA